MAYRDLKDWDRMKEAAERYLDLHALLQRAPSDAGYVVHNTTGELWKVHLAMGNTPGAGNPAPGRASILRSPVLCSPILGMPENHCRHL